MASQDREGMTVPARIDDEGRKIFGLTLRDILGFLGSLALPLMLGIFTVIITFDQRQESRMQRIEDQKIAREQREQDLNISAHQREQDQINSRLQRENDKKITDEKRAADDLNAERARNMSQAQREHELSIEALRYQQENARQLDDLLLLYLDDIGTLLEKNNGSLTNNPVTSALAHAKTLHVIQQLGAKRSSQLLQFLYDAGQLSKGKNPLNLAGAKLHSVDLSGLPGRLNMNELSLAGADLSYANFTAQNLINANFSHARLNNASFSVCACSGAKFDYVLFKNT